MQQPFSVLSRPPRERGGGFGSTAGGCGFSVTMWWCGAGNVAFAVSEAIFWKASQHADQNVFARLSLRARENKCDITGATQACIPRCRHKSNNDDRQAREFNTITVQNGGRRVQTTVDGRRRIFLREVNPARRDAKLRGSLPRSWSWRYRCYRRNGGNPRVHPSKKQSQPHQDSDFTQCDETRKIKQQHG